MVIDITGCNDGDQSATVTANLVVGQYGDCTGNIPLDPLMGRVFLVDVKLQDTGAEFDIVLGGAKEDGVEVNGNGSGMELGIYVVSGKVQLTQGFPGQPEIETGIMAVFGVTSDFVGCLRALETNTVVVLLGGTALPEKRHLFWNFCSADPTKVQAATEAWRVLDRKQFPEVVNEANDDSIPLPRAYSRKDTGKNGEEKKTSKR